MSPGRVLTSMVASAAVAGGAVVALGMASAQSTPAADRAPRVPVPTRTSRPAFLPAPARAAGALRVTGPSRAATAPARPTASSTGRATGAGTTPSPTPTARAAVTPRQTATPPPPAGRTSPATSPRPTAPRTTAPRTTAPRRIPHTTRSRAASRTPAHRARPRPRRATGHALPLGGPTGNAARVITVTARSYGSTTARLQAWHRVRGGGWARSGSAVTAWIGADGVSRHASESRSATPVGSFTVTRAFGRDADPGTRLPYVRTTPADWWISEPGALYNTMQRCSSGCGFRPGAPNEHLYYETPYYDYAVVIDYNTRNAPGGVHAGRGSAFFLHVTVGAPTAGCVAIPQRNLVPLMRWLRPATHPRILIGVG